MWDSLASAQWQIQWQLKWDCNLNILVSCNSWSMSLQIQLLYLLSLLVVKLQFVAIQKSSMWRLTIALHVHMTFSVILWTGTFTTLTFLSPRTQKWCFLMEHIHWRNLLRWLTVTTSPCLDMGMHCTAVMAYHSLLAGLTAMEHQRVVYSL